MRPFLSRYSPPIFAVTRVVIALLYWCHGAQKLLGLFGGIGGTGHTAPIPSWFGFAGIIEFVGGILLMTGTFTPFAAFVCSGEMAMGFFQSHFPRGGWPIQNGGEMAVFYCFFFLYLSSVGAGPWSLDGLLFNAGAGR